MNLKKKLRAFFTLTGKSDGGFTLVELIVVIAIIAILGGVAVPAYSGYVKKANEAADEQLLAELNTAFASACVINGEDYYNRGDKPSITITNGEVAVNALTTGSEKVNDSFATFFEGGRFKNEDIELYYNGQLGAFKDMAGNIFNQIFASLSLGGYVTTVNESTFGTIGAEGLMTRVDDVTALAEALLGTNAGASLKRALSADFETIAASMGMSGQQLEEEIAAQGENADAYYNNLLANYAVLQVANTTSGKETSVLLDDLKTGMSTTDISNMIASNDSESSKEGVAKAAMMYAMYTAYANQLPDGEAKNEALANLKDMDTFVSAIGDETQSGTGFMTYLGGEQATKDMDGFLASMNIITSSTANNTEATRDLLENGYGNPDLVIALQGLMGK